MNQSNKALINKLFIETLPNKINLYHFNKADIHKVMFQFIKNMALHDDLFFSYTCSDDEVSLFIDSKCEIKNINYSVMQGYRIIKMYDTVDNIDQIGIVSKISTIMKEANIPILYVNSFNENYILVEEKDLGKAKDELYKNDFINV